MRFLRLIAFLRHYAKYTELLPLVGQIIDAAFAGEWSKVAELMAELIEQAGLLSGGPTVFGMSATGVPAAVSARIDSLAAHLQASA